MARVGDSVLPCCFCCCPAEELHCREAAGGESSSMSRAALGANLAQKELVSNLCSSTDKCPSA